MRRFLLAGATTLALAVGATAASAQMTDTATAPVEQVQANPPSAEPASPVPPNPASAETPVPPAMPADPGYQAGPYKGALTAPPAEAMSKTYPVCTRRLQDNCQNPGEGGAPGRSRAIKYYRPKN